MEIASLILVILTTVATGYGILNSKHSPVLKPTKTIRVFLAAFLLFYIYIFCGIYFSNIAVFDKDISALIVKIFTLTISAVYALSIYRNKRAMEKNYN